MATPYSSTPTYSFLAALVSERLSPAGISQVEWAQLISLAVEQDLGPMLLWAVRQERPVP